MKKINKKINIGCWITTFNPSATHLMSSLGFGWLCIDMEHSTITFDQMSSLISTIENNGSVPFVRVGSNDKLNIKKALDAGAKGVIIPMINTAKDAKNAIDSTYYYPKGKRGVGLARAQEWGRAFDSYQESIKGTSTKICPKFRALARFRLKKVKKKNKRSHYPSLFVLRSNTFAIFRISYYIFGAGWFGSIASKASPIANNFLSLLGNPSMPIAIGSPLLVVPIGIVIPGYPPILAGWTLWFEAIK